MGWGFVCLLPASGKALSRRRCIAAWSTLPLGRMSQQCILYCPNVTGQTLEGNHVNPSTPGAHAPKALCSKHFYFHCSIYVHSLCVAVDFLITNETVQYHIHSRESTNETVQYHVHSMSTLSPNCSHFINFMQISEEE